jgi:hypothetical protein
MAIAASTASAQASATDQQQLEITVTATHTLEIAKEVVTITVPAIAAGATTAQGTGQSTFAFATNESDQAISVALDAATPLPTDAQLFVALQGGAEVEVDGTPRVARANISGSQADQTIDYRFVSGLATPTQTHSVTVVFTFTAGV